MKIITNKNIEENHFLLWDEFIHNHENGNIFQSSVMYRTYCETSGYKPIILLAISKEGLVCGVLLSVIQRVFDNFFGRFITRAIIGGGPIYSNIEILTFLLHEYDKIIKGKAIYSEIRNLWNNNSDANIFKENGYNFNDHLNFFVDLKLNKEVLWSNVHSKRRNEIRRAYKNNLSFHEETTEITLYNCYSILIEVYKQAKIPLVNYSFFKALLNNSTPNNGIKVFIAKLDEEIIGCMLTLVYKNTIYDLYAGSYRKHYKKYPNDLIPWEVFLWGKENKFEKFDFGGAGKPTVEYGVRDYKKKFGGNLVNLGRYIAPHNKFLYKISVKGFSIWRKIKK